MLPRSCFSQFQYPPQARRAFEGVLQSELHHACFSWYGIILSSFALFILPMAASTEALCVLLVHLQHACLRLPLLACSGPHRQATAPATPHHNLIVNISIQEEWQLFRVPTAVEGQHRRRGSFVLKTQGEHATDDAIVRCGTTQVYSRFCTCVVIMTARALTSHTIHLPA